MVYRWYTKANQINPKNGKPYNQLALLAVYEKRKLDAVYYYMRSLMASNPFQSAKDSLLSLFEDYRKKVCLTGRFAFNLLNFNFFTVRNDG